MKAENVEALPSEAFSRGVGKLKERKPSKNVLILGFDTEYDSKTQEIICYQLSDGTWENSVLLEAHKDLTWQELSQWVCESVQKWGYALRDINTLLLVSHFSTAELSHIENFWEDAEIRRVSAAQVYNASYRINAHVRLVVMDNYHFWNVGNNGSASLAAVAEKFGERKMEYDTSNVSRSTLQDSNFREYALWDAVVCARVFHAFRKRLWDDYRVDVIQYPTSASLAMAIYRKDFLPNTFEAPHPNVRRQAWRSLWGGRAEAYRSGDYFGNFTLRDVKSLYPSAAKLIRKLPRKDDWVERVEPESWNGLCRVKFEFPEDVKFPSLPVWGDGRLIWPLSGTSDCTLYEAQVAKRLGAKLEFVTVHEYVDGDESLAEFFDFFGKQKNDAENHILNENGSCSRCNDPQAEYCDMVQRELSKLMQNSLIGKFSQNKGDVDVEALKTFAKDQMLPLELVAQPSFFHPDKPKSVPRIGGHIMPEWSALILGKARAIMASLLNDVGESWICSTDSLLVPAELDSLVDEAMKRYGVILTSKNKHGKPTRHVRVVRNRVYVGEGEDGEILFGASHAIHLGSRRRDCEACKNGECKEPTHSAFRFILSDLTEYNKTRRIGLKTAIRMNRRFFDEESAPMEFTRAWDFKRKLHADGSTAPWRSLDSMLDAQGKPPILRPKSDTGSKQE